MEIMACVVVLMVFVAALFHNIGDENGCDRRRREEQEADEQTF